MTSREVVSTRRCGGKDRGSERKKRTMKKANSNDNNFEDDGAPIYVWTIR